MSTQQCWCALLKYYNENDAKNHQLEKLSISNDLLKFGMFYYLFIISKLIFIFELYNYHVCSL